MRNRRNRVSTLEILWERRFFYPLGLMVSSVIALINLLLGMESTPDEVIIICISSSFVFGFLIHGVVKDAERMKEEGRYYIFSKEGIVHLALTFITIVCGVIIQQLI